MRTNFVLDEIVTINHLLGEETIAASIERCRLLDGWMIDWMDSAHLQETTAVSTFYLP